MPRISRIVSMTLVIAGLVVSWTSAGTMNLNVLYNNGDPFMSDHHLWTDVMEMNGLDADSVINFFQDPAALHDTLIINPTGFRAEVNPGAGDRQVESQLEMVITGQDDAAIPGIRVIERGDYNVLGTSSSTQVAAELDYTWKVLQGTSVGVSGNGSVRFEDVPDNFGEWSLDVTADIPAGATQVRFSFDNRLTSQAADGGSLSFIAMKQLVIAIVPEPSSFVLVWIGLLGLVRGRSR